MGAFRVSDDAQSRSITDERENRRNDEVLDGLTEIDALLRGIIPDIKATQQIIIRDEAGSITREKSSRDGVSGKGQQSQDLRHCQRPQRTPNFRPTRRLG